MNKQESKAVVSPSAGLSLIEDASLWLAKIDLPSESALKKPVSPTWNSLWSDLLKLASDLFTLCKPSLLLAVTGGLIFAIIDKLVQVALSSTWLCSLTIGDVLQTAQLIPAPLLWTLLLIGSIMGSGRALSEPT